ncbi:Uncharacterized protein APZ42_025564 [Daphnia magna]|uniref:Uncharacterized protein n=1 Tax=Daphnia magna TaxID=35525 RepID=A0A164SYK6_9CRUS|nr:Uncharacterized protein APZ42_025564 [Daphnia magna]
MDRVTQGMHFRVAHQCIGVFIIGEQRVFMHPIVGKPSITGEITKNKQRLACVANEWDGLPMTNDMKGFGREKYCTKHE